MRIGDFDLAEHVLVVAEIGNNHEGDAGRARAMIEAAAEAGAPAVKMQTFRTRSFISSSDEKRIEQLSRFELTFDEFAELAQLARSHGMLFLSTPLDLESADFLEGVVDGFKIASGDNDFYPLIERVAASERPLVISTGASDVPTIERAVAAVEKVRGADAKDSLALLHCVSSYPAEDDSANLLSIPFLAERFPYTIGYSDHTLGGTAALAAVALGARLIEKHFTLEGIESDFRDHELSATPSALGGLLDAIAQLEQMLGTPAKQVGPAEAGIAEAIRRSIAAAGDLEAGRRLEPSDLIWVRPGSGLRPGEESALVGHTLKMPKRRGELLLADDVD
ncbi:MAG TPA: N-acetylneuraminate synthase family protein [Thermoleophilaceae bacterium]